MRRRLLGIPLGLLVVLLVIGAVAAAGYAFVTAEITVTVSEPMTVEYKWAEDGSWITVTDGTFTQSLDCYAGDSHDFWVRVSNHANNDIDVTLSMSGAGGNVSLSGWTNPTTVPGDGDTGEIKLTASVNADAPEGTYDVTLEFNRG